MGFDPARMGSYSAVATTYTARHNIVERTCGYIVAKNAQSYARMTAASTPFRILTRFPEPVDLRWRKSSSATSPRDAAPEHQSFDYSSKPVADKIE